MIQECNCPYCPLLAANVQVCDVMVKIILEGDMMNFAIKCNEEHRPLSKQFYILAAMARNNHKLPVGYSADLSTGGCSCYVYHTKKNEYKICFHALDAPPVAPEDPVAMD